ncbi:hypothetical protein [Micromonospora coerulea]|uniref:hypothetical protein n=1 Tax=Micromonospora coerulea TaxID=47856 RepID=UPI001908CDB4|nr:hypothetical protein [Micromonospora veneta]
MGNDMEQRLTAAAQALREHELTGHRLRDLAGRIRAMRAHVDVLRQRLDAEQADVDRLEGLTLSRVVASFRGARGDALARERAEALAARLRLAEAERLLTALQEEVAAAKARQRRLASAPREYEALLDERERALADSADPRGSRLLELADARGRLAGEHRELTEAVRAANNAEGALNQLRGLLDRASGWSTYDTLGGGLISSVIKHEILDQAAQAAARVDANLATLWTELADVTDAGPYAPSLGIGELTRFTDIWLDNIVTDFAVLRRVENARGDVDRSLNELAPVHRLLRERAAGVGARLSALEAERADLLNRP